MIITIEFTEQEKRQILQNSIERVINNAIDCGEKGQELFSTDYNREKASILWQDCEELKSVVCKIWRVVQDEFHKGAI